MGDARPIFEPRISIITLGVSDMRRSIRFYRDGLGFPTTVPDDAGWAIFRTSGTRLSLYPRHLLAEDIAPGLDPGSQGFGGITLAHNTRTREAVDQILLMAQRAGGRILKPAAETGWGGYGGYFADPDGHPWEVAWSPREVFAEDGTICGGEFLAEPDAPQT